MKVISVNVGVPKEILIGGKSVRTGIFKKPVAGMVRVWTLGLEGDNQVDRRVHGGPDKAVYIYPFEHYEWWRRELGEKLEEFGAFGENLTTEGLLEDSVTRGDRIAIGTAIFQVTKPRQPCFKLAAKFQREDMIQRFRDSGRTGFYVRVLEEGWVQAGDAIDVLE
jgi:MOSC domain-containing protein YiiM